MNKDQAYWSIVFDMSKKEKEDYDRITKSLNPKLKKEASELFNEIFLKDDRYISDNSG